LWGSQSWLQPAFSRLPRSMTNFSGYAAGGRSWFEEPPERRLQARLPNAA